MSEPKSRLTLPQARDRGPPVREDGLDLKEDAVPFWSSEGIASLLLEDEVPLEEEF